MDKIKVLVVDDSALAREVLTQILETDPQIEVIATAKDGKKAVELAQIIKPDLITMDILMPGIDGLETTRQIMAYCPTPIVVLTEFDFKTHSSLVFDALESGALDVMEKPSLERWKVLSDECETLIRNIKVLAKVKVITHLAGKNKKVAQKQVLHTPGLVKEKSKVVAIATSTGGPNALLNILSKLPKNFPAPILVVQHITKGFIKGLVNWLDSECKLDIREAVSGSLLEAGVVYICPTDFHLKVSSNFKILLDKEALPIKGFRPSANILFESVGQVFADRVIGVILTGMGDDGTEGLKVLKASGGQVIAQDKKSSVIFGMPASAIKANVVDKICSLDTIAEEITKLLQK